MKCPTESGRVVLVLDDLEAAAKFLSNALEVPSLIQFHELLGKRVEKLRPYLGYPAAGTAQHDR